MLAQKRVPKRKPTFVRGMLEGENSSQEVFVRDLSVDGALLDVSETLSVFEPITLTCGDSRINGIVAWSTNDRLGIEFSEPMSGDTLVDSFNASIRVSAPRKHNVKSPPTELG